MTTTKRFVRQRYLEPVEKKTNVELPGGGIMRKQNMAAVIDRPGYERLKVRIKELEKQRDKSEVCHLLSRLRKFDMLCGFSLTVVSTTNNAQQEVAELF